MDHSRVSRNDRCLCGSGKKYTQNQVADMPTGEAEGGRLACVRCPVPIT